MWRGLALGLVLVGGWAAVDPLVAQTQTSPARGTPQGAVPGGGSPGFSGLPRTPPVTGPAAQPLVPQVPAWVPLLTPEHQKYVEDILQYWELRSSKVNRYQSGFKRWEYDPVFGPRETFKTYSEGTIKFSSPDKGMFQVEKILTYQPPAAANEKPNWVERPDVFGEHWICDGQSVFEHDHRQKRLIQRQLPPEMQGQAIAEGPLPFLFGAKADDIKRRFWIRVITPADRKGEYWLEAVPKTQADAESFKMVHIMIDEAEYLPIGMVIFDRNYEPGLRPARTAFQFEKREVNFTLDQLNIFKRAFFEPETPKGWTKVVYRYDQPAPPPDQAAVPNPPVKKR